MSRKHDAHFMLLHALRKYRQKFAVSEIMKHKLTNLTELLFFAFISYFFILYSEFSVTAQTLLSYAMRSVMLSGRY
jgi:hypothetical protein